jgi:hypothetical protein
MAKDSKTLRRELLSNSLNAPKKNFNAKRSLEIITSVLEGVDLKAAFKEKKSVAHPHSYAWPFEYRPPLLEGFPYKEVGVVFGYVNEYPSNLEFLSYENSLVESSSEAAFRWRIIHELAHKEVGVPFSLNPKSLVTWEWDVLKKQREIEKNLGFVVSEELIAKDSNSVMQDVVYRSLTGKIPKAHEEGFVPYDSLAPLDFALSIIEEFQ